ncbi:unnamed protein product [Closterium sp. NIES-54]
MSADKLSARAIPCGPAPSGVSQVDPLPGSVPVEVAGYSGAARGTESGGAEPGGAEPTGVEPGGAELEGPGGVEPEGVEPGDAESEGAESGGAEPQDAALSGGPAGASPSLSPRPETLSPQQLREWLNRRARLWSGATGAGGTRDVGARGSGVTVGAGATGGISAFGRGGARTRGTGASGTGGVGGARARDPTEPGAAGARDAGAGGTGAGGAGARGAGVVGARAGGTGAGGARAGGAAAVDPGAGGAGGTMRPRLYFVPLLHQPTSPLPAPSSYTMQTGGPTERREPASRPASSVRTGCRVPRPRPPPVSGTHAMALRASSVPLRVPLPPPPESSLPAVPDPEYDLARAASFTVSRLLATVVTDPSFESTAACALIAELLPA